MALALCRWLLLGIGFLGAVAIPHVLDNVQLGLAAVQLVIGGSRRHCTGSLASELLVQMAPIGRSSVRAVWLCCPEFDFCPSWVVEAGKGLNPLGHHMSATDPLLPVSDK